LQQEKKPMHTKDIADGIQEQFHFFVKPTSLGTMLYRRAIETKKTFVKDRKEENTYGLKEWPNPEVEEH
jgi:hypothetical protein